MIPRILLVSFLALNLGFIDVGAAIKDAPKFLTGEQVDQLVARGRIPLPGTQQSLTLSDPTREKVELAQVVAGFSRDKQASLVFQSEVVRRSSEKGTRPIAHFRYEVVLIGSTQEVRKTPTFLHLALVPDMPLPSCVSLAKEEDVSQIYHGPQLLNQQAIQSLYTRKEHLCNMGCQITLGAAGLPDLQRANTLSTKYAMYRLYRSGFPQQSRHKKGRWHVTYVGEDGYGGQLNIPVILRAPGLHSLPSDVLLRLLEFGVSPRALGLSPFSRGPWYSPAQLAVSQCNAMRPIHHGSIPRGLDFGVRHELMSLGQISLHMDRMGNTTVPEFARFLSRYGEMTYLRIWSFKRDLFHGACQFFGGETIFLPKLRSLLILGNGRPLDITALAPVLKGAPHLNELRLHTQGLTLEHATTLAQCQIQGVNDLCLNYNPSLGDESMRLIFSRLSDCEPVTEPNLTLLLFNTGISSVSMWHLNTSGLYGQLSHLDVGHNNLGLEGIEALCAEGVGESPLKSLNLRNTNIGNDGFRILHRSLRFPVLSWLGVTGNNLSPACIEVGHVNPFWQARLSFLDLDQNPALTENQLRGVRASYTQTQIHPTARQSAM